MCGVVEDVGRKAAQAQSKPRKVADAAFGVQ
jgi:hypothetical protein